MKFCASLVLRIPVSWLVPTWRCVGRASDPPWLPELKPRLRAGQGIGAGDRVELGRQFGRKSARGRLNTRQQQDID